MSAEAYYSEKDRCWFVPVATELFEEPRLREGIEPVRVEMTDMNVMLITLLEPVQSWTTTDLDPTTGEVSR